LVWKWHFAVGLVATPLVAIVALTGALYAFEPELQRLAHSELAYVEPAGSPRPLDELTAATASRCDVSGISIAGPADRSYLFFCRGSDRMLVVDPYRGMVLGDVDPSSKTATAKLFEIVFALHWEMMLGDRGRLLVEWATSVTVLLMISGVILWWPRGKRRGGGVLWPRRRLSGRQWLRDLHAVFGAYSVPVLFALAATGLMWTVHAGDGRWNKLAAEPEQEHPTSKVIEGAPRIGVDAALAGARIDLATSTRSLWIGIPGGKDKADAPYSFWISDDEHRRPWLIESVLVDAYSGAEIHREGWDDKSALGKVDGMRYSIHVGAILGLPGRIAACIASLILAALCITGPWMWWKRRPKGKLGVPPAARAPWPLYVVVAALGWLLPTVGITLLLVVAVELVLWLVRSRERTAAP
jgi:uncharacterized iron-regulated membrane protein